MMHEEWLATDRSAITCVRLTGAEELSITRDSILSPITSIYRPYLVEVHTSWPDDRIGNAAAMVHVHANEVHFSGALSQLKVILLLSDLDEVPAWLDDLVSRVHEKNFGR